MGKMLEMKNIKKVFPGVVALDGVNISVDEGEVLALLGENGAGKSTLMKVLSGVHKPEEGQIFIDGKEVNINGVNDATDLGISIIYQELSLFPNLSVAANIYALAEPTKMGLIDDKEIERKAKELLDRIDVDINPKTLVKDLSISSQQMVEIAKSLVKEPKIIIMDEPTSALSDKEVKNLFRIINKLRDEGKAIIYISHRMEEIFEITDKIAVLRDGKYIGTISTKEATTDELIKMMVGREMDQIYPEKDFKFLKDEKLLELKGYTKKGFYEDIDLFIRPGEILGLYGLMGSGRTEIAQGIFGVLKKEKGEMFIDGKKVNISKPFDAIDNGIAFITENRRDEGLVISGSVKENVSMANIDNILSNFRFLDLNKEKDITKKYVESMNIKTPSINQIVNKLSGGNQQKIVISKWFEIDPKIIIMDEPTRGIDVGAKFEIYKLMNELAAKGAGIILISSELPEILNISDRLLVVNNQKVIKELDPKKTSQEEIMGYIIGNRGE